LRAHRSYRVGKPWYGTVVEKEKKTPKIPPEIPAPREKKKKEKTITGKEWGVYLGGEKKKIKRKPFGGNQKGERNWPLGLTAEGHRTRHGEEGTFQGLASLTGGGQRWDKGKGFLTKRRGSPYKEGKKLLKGQRQEGWGEGEKKKVP